MASGQESQTFHWHYSEFDDTNFQIRNHAIFFLLFLFCLILVITLIYLYLKWVFRFGPLNTARSLPHAPPQQTTTRPPPPPRRGLDPSTINNLPIVILQSDSTNPRELGECSICLGIFEDGEKVKVLPDCRHCYHSECVDMWLTTKSSCPLCRASLTRPDSAV